MLAGGAVVSLLRPVHPELVPVALAAVILSAVGTGVGIYLAYRIIHDYF